MRDGVRLATDLYLPPVSSAPVLAVRTPYGRGSDKLAGVFLSMARRGYVVVSQDCRGTGESEPDHWDYYMYEPEDGVDLVEWVSQQAWFDGFLYSCGGSYVGQTQWCMAMHPAVSAIAPEVSGLGIAVNTAHLYMFLNAYARSVGKGESKVAVHYTELERLMLPETLAGGYFNAPLEPMISPPLLQRFPELRDLPPTQARRRLWEHYCRCTCAQRAEFVRQAFGTSAVSILEVESLSEVFGHRISHDSHTLPHTDMAECLHQLQAPPLMITGWYDWGLNDALATWQLLKQSATESVRSRSRLLISPGAHNALGYHEGMETRPELQHNHRTANNIGLLLQWYSSVRRAETDRWPTVIYYLMGANEWRVLDDWPPPAAKTQALYLGSKGDLTFQVPTDHSPPDTYTYNPEDPTPTVGGSIVSYVYSAGSVDVSSVQQRSDVLTYTTAPLERDLDVVGPLRLILYASSSAVDTDFAGRLSDVFPDGRAIQLQNGVLRARYRNVSGEPTLLEPRRVYRLEIDLWATANRFRAGHRLRLDISSADFPRFDRNSNRGGQAGAPLPALQTVFHDAERPSHLLVSIL